MIEREKASVDAFRHLRCVVAGCAEEVESGCNSCSIHLQGIAHDVFDSREDWECPDCRGKMEYDAKRVAMVCPVCHEAFGRRALMRCPSSGIWDDAC